MEEEELRQRGGGIEGTGFHQGRGGIHSCSLSHHCGHGLGQREGDLPVPPQGLEDGEGSGLQYHETAPVHLWCALLQGKCEVFPPSLPTSLPSPPLPSPPLPSPPFPSPPLPSPYSLLLSPSLLGLVDPIGFSLPHRSVSVLGI